MFTVPFQCQPDDPLNCLSASSTNECVPHCERHVWGSCQKHVLQPASVSLSLRQSDRDILCGSGNRFGLEASPHPFRIQRLQMGVVLQWTRVHRLLYYNSVDSKSVIQIADSRENLCSGWGYMERVVQR